MKTWIRVVLWAAHVSLLCIALPLGANDRTASPAPHELGVESSSRSGQCSILIEDAARCVVERAVERVLVCPPDCPSFGQRDVGQPDVGQPDLSANSRPTLTSTLPSTSRNTLVSSSESSFKRCCKHR